MTPRSQAEKGNNQKSGSPQSGEPVYLTIGKLRRTHGVKGEIIMDLLTDSPEMIKPELTVYIGSHHKPQVFSSVRAMDQSLLVKFTGYEDCDQATVFRNQFVAIKTSDAEPLQEGKFYQHEVIGMEVVDEDGNRIGKISEIIPTGANDVYVVQPEDGEEILIPAVKLVVLKIDPLKGRMIVKLPEWE